MDRPYDLPNPTGIRFETEEAQYCRPHIVDPERTLSALWQPHLPTACPVQDEDPMPVMVGLIRTSIILKGVNALKPHTAH